LKKLYILSAYSMPHDSVVGHFSLIFPTKRLGDVNVFSILLLIYWKVIFFVR
jgi:hypothetical protein